MRIRYRDQNGAAYNHDVHESFFIDPTTTITIKTSYLISLAERNWPCPFLQVLNDPNNDVTQALHIYFVIRYRELKNKYRDPRIRLGKSITQRSPGHISPKDN